MSISLSPPLAAPKNGRRYLVLGIARISTDKQDERSLADQEALYRRWLDDRLGDAYDLRMISGQGSGEVLDRAEMLQAEAEMESGDYDLSIMEDLGRLTRRLQAVIFCERAEDQATRVIALNDGVDTGSEAWRMGAMFAAMRHELYNADTGKRIRRSLRNRFQHGGVVQTVPFCYSKPENCKSDEQLEKIIDLEPFVLGIIGKLESGASYSEVADWLNEHQVPLGRWSRRRNWNGIAVRNVVFNPLLKGVRVRNNKITKRTNRTGRRRSVAAPPEERLERQCPHLAWIDADRYDRLVAKLTAKNEKYTVGRNNGVDPRRGRPTKRTRWPGQHVVCGVCKQSFVYGGHGQKTRLMCNGARAYTCWQGATFDGPVAAARIKLALFDAVAAMPGFDEAAREQLRSQLEAGGMERDQQRHTITNRLQELDRQIGRVTDAIAGVGLSDALRQKLVEIEAEKATLQSQMLLLPPQAPRLLTLPSADALREKLREAFGELPDDSPEFGRLMHRVVRKLEVFPYRPLDGGHVVLRAHVVANLLPLLPELEPVAEFVTVTEVTFVVDLFDPPQRIRHLEEILQLQGQGKPQWQIAADLKLTLPVIQKAVKLHRLRQTLGTADVYEQVLGPPGDGRKLRRHLHPRYRAER